MDLHNHITIMAEINILDGEGIDISVLAINLPGSGGLGKFLKLLDQVTQCQR